MAADVHGILLLDKPLGLSSAAAVARAKWLFQARKAGHTGSLDPLEGSCHDGRAWTARGHIQVPEPDET